MSERLRALLSHRRLPQLLAATAVLLCLPALAIGRVLDDIFQRVVCTGYAEQLGLAATPNDLFRFADGVPAHGTALIERGAFPWFTNPAIKFAFLRPIASALHRLDYALFPSSPAAMHLHSLAWLAVLALLVTALHRRFDGPAWVVGLGAAFFALDDAHGLPAAWIANRNALVATSFGVAALLAYDVGRRDRSRRHAVAAPLLFGLALLSGEAALGMAGYFLAHALFIDRAPIRARVIALAPIGLAVVGYAAAYKGFGYGASGSTLYIDPLRSPGRFAVALVERAPALVAAQLGPLSSDFTVMLRSPGQRVGWLVASLLVAAPIVAFLWPVLRRDRVAAFFATGAALALVPVCATFANDRLLLACGVGASAALARAVAWSRGADFVAGAPPPSRRAALFGGALLIWHGVLAPAQLPLKLFSLTLMGRVGEAAKYPDALAGKDVVMVSAPMLYGCTYTPMIQFERTGTYPAAMICLADSHDHVDVTRDAASSLVLRPANGFARPIMDELFRDESFRFSAGQRVALRGCVLEVLEVDATGRPMAARATFAGALETPQRVFTAWTAKGIEPFALPAIGQTVRVPGATMDQLVLRP